MAWITTQPLYIAFMYLAEINMMKERTVQEANMAIAWRSCHLIASLNEIDPSPGGRYTKT